VQDDLGRNAFTILWNELSVSPNIQNDVILDYSDPVDGAPRVNPLWIQTATPCYFWRLESRADKLEADIYRMVELMVSICPSVVTISCKMPRPFKLFPWWVGSSFNISTW
jgi:hypothetical protein